MWTTSSTTVSPSTTSSPRGQGGSWAPPRMWATEAGRIGMQSPSLPVRICGSPLLLLSMRWWVGGCYPRLHLCHHLQQPLHSTRQLKVSLGTNPHWNSIWRHALFPLHIGVDLKVSQILYHVLVGNSSPLKTPPFKTLTCLKCLKCSSGVGTPNFGEMKGGDLTLTEWHLWRNDFHGKLVKAHLKWCSWILDLPLRNEGFLHHLKAP